MTYDDALKLFGSGRAIAEALGLSKGRVSQFRAAGGFSYPIQCVLEKESHGRLSARREDEPSVAFGSVTKGGVTPSAITYKLCRP